MEAGGLGLPSFSLPADVSKLVPGPAQGLVEQAQGAVQGAAQGAIQQAQGAAQGAVQGALSSDIANKAQGLADKAGLGSQFAAAKDAVQAAADKALGIKPPPCYNVDVPSISDVVVETSKNMLPTTSLSDWMFSYVIVDNKDPAPYQTKAKNNLWYTSIALSAALVMLGTAYGQIK